MVSCESPSGLLPFRRSASLPRTTSSGFFLGNRKSGVTTKNTKITKRNKNGRTRGDELKSRVPCLYRHPFFLCDLCVLCGYSRLLILGRRVTGDGIQGPLLGAR